MLAQSGRFLVGLFTGLLVGGLLYMLVSRPRGIAIELIPPPSPSPLRVHVAGGVGAPGVYPLPSGAIVADAIAAAGGARPGADLDALNLAAPIDDNDQVFVPMVGTALPTDPSARNESAAVNLNSATLPELESLPGIGPTLANAIVAYRDQNGPFLSVEDLIHVPGIGPTRLSQLRDFVRVE
ncbi:MAG TPA: helix-hairpin-helix domain-containing protein [Anaerolineales bacterium]|nr:helix-hairpin-helix domain-containing protein [Anaerolineales bacterium]